MTWKPIRKFFWLYSEERWWADAVFAGVGVATGIAAWDRVGWLGAIAVGIVIFGIRELMYHRLVRVHRKKGNGGASNRRP